MQVAVIGVFTTFVTTIGVIIVAIVNSRKATEIASDSSMEQVLHERLLLRDEQIKDLTADKDRLQAEVEQLRRLAEQQQSAIKTWQDSIS